MDLWKLLQGSGDYSSTVAHSFTGCTDCTDPVKELLKQNSVLDCYFCQKTTSIPRLGLPFIPTDLRVMVLRDNVTFDDDHQETKQDATEVDQENEGEDEPVDYTMDNEVGVDQCFRKTDRAIIVCAGCQCLVQYVLAQGKGQEVDKILEEAKILLFGQKPTMDILWTPSLPYSDAARGYKIMKKVTEQWTRQKGAIAVPFRRDEMFLNLPLQPAHPLLGYAMMYKVVNPESRKKGEPRPIILTSGIFQRLARRFVTQEQEDALRKWIQLRLPLFSEEKMKLFFTESSSLPSGRCDVDEALIKKMADYGELELRIAANKQKQYPLKKEMKALLEEKAKRLPQVKSALSRMPTGALKDEKSKFIFQLNAAPKGYAISQRMTQMLENFVQVQSAMLVQQKLVPASQQPDLERALQKSVMAFVTDKREVTSNVRVINTDNTRYKRRREN